MLDRSRLLDDYLSETELAKELGVCVDTLQRWRRLRQAPAHTRVGRSVLYHKDAIRVWLREREVGADR